MSVASASSDPNQPSFSAEPSASLINPTLGTNWQLDSVSGLYKLTNPDTTQGKPSLTIGMYDSGKGKFGNDVAQGIFSTNGIGVKIPILRADLYSASGLNKTLTFNFSNVGDNYALMLKDDSNSSQSLGSLQIWGQNASGNNATSTSTFVGRFGGKGILGNILVNTVAKKARFFFLNGANLEGNIILQNGTGNGAYPVKDGENARGNFFNFDQGVIKGYIKATGGNSSSNVFSFNSQRTENDAHIAGGILVANATGGNSHTFVFTSNNKSQVVISGGLKDDNLGNSSTDYSTNLTGGNYAIVVKADPSSSAKNYDTVANFIFDTDAKVGKVSAVNYQTSRNSLANYTIKTGNRVIFSSIDSNQQSNTTISLEDNTSVTVSDSMSTANDGTINIEFSGKGTFTNNTIGGSSNQGVININLKENGNGTIIGNLNNNSVRGNGKGVNVNFVGSNSSLSIIGQTPSTQRFRNSVTHTINTVNLSGTSGNVLNAKSGTTTINSLSLSDPTLSSTPKKQNELTINGGDMTITTITLSGSEGNVLNVNNNSTTITTLAFSGQKGNEFNANGGTTNITTFNFNGSASSGENVFNANSGTTTIGTLTLSNSTTNNTINANGGSTTITNAVSLNNNTTLNLGIGNGNLTLTKNLTAGNSNTGTANINFTGNGTLTSNLSVGSSGILASNLSTTATNGTININITGGNGTIAGKLNTNSTTTDSKGININFKGSGSSLSLIDSSVSNVQAVAQQASQPNHTINTLKAEGEGNTLNLSGQARNSGTIPNRTTFQTLKINDLKADSKSINFIVYANPDANDGNSPRADRIIIEGSKASSSVGAGGAVASASAGITLAEAQDTAVENKTHYLGVVGDPHKIIGKTLYDPSGSNNIALATVKNDANITLEAVTNISGFSLITYEYQTASTDVNGSSSSGGGDSSRGTNGYTTYFLGSAKSLGATEASQEVSASALATNYDLYLANMNSLNKRMGELRDNPHSQGVWARVFNGMQTSSFALQTQAVYTTIQAGYDYAFGSEGANNYVGVALSYANSSTKSKTINELNQTTNTTQTKGIDAVTSNAVEIAVYNSYVQDGASVQSGWSNGLFSDSIVKFSYISSDLTLLDQSNTYNTTNYALTLSQEIGYRFLLGSEGEWNIDPQAEVALGYLNQSNLRQTLSAQNYLDGIQNAIVTLRSRVGASFGYDFKKFTEGKSINAKLYVGAYYVYDYIAGGDVSLTDNFGAKVSLSPLASTGRAVMNVGTNIGVQDNTRIYFDFEKSFGGSITTDYQVNLGVRYSFGESNGYMPKGTKIETKAPLRVEETKEKQEQTQTSKNQESAEVKQESKKAQ